jgi:hypothetical protein
MNLSSVEENNIKKFSYKSLHIKDKANCIYVKLLFKYRELKLNLLEMPDIDFIKSVLCTLPENMHNEDMIYIIHKSILKNKDVEEK